MTMGAAFSATASSGASVPPSTMLSKMMSMSQFGGSAPSRIFWVQVEGRRGVEVGRPLDRGHHAPVGQ